MIQRFNYHHNYIHTLTFVQVIPGSISDTSVHVHVYMCTHLPTFMEHFQLVNTFPNQETGLNCLYACPIMCAYVHSFLFLSLFITHPIGYR